MHNQIISEQEPKGSIECVDHHSTPCSGTHYIPHHAVEKDSTTSIRIVFDCRCCQSSNSPCLNDCLFIGSPCNDDLCAILASIFALIGISSDVEKVFLHVRLHPDERNYTRFFWLSNPADPWSDFCKYCLKVGTTSSPFMLNAELLYSLICAQILILITSSRCDLEQDAMNYY